METLKEKLEIWEKNPVGKCGSCSHALEINGVEVKCNSEAKVCQVVQTSYFGIKWAKEFREQGFIKIFTVEYAGRFSCDSWSKKVG